MGKLGYNKKGKAPLSQSMIIDTAGTPERLGGFYTASSISFDNATSRILDSASMLASKMFRVGQRIEVSGSSDNDGQYNITAVNSAYLEVDGTLTDEVAGTPDTIASVDRTFCKNVIVQALGTNGGNVAVGGSNVDLSAGLGEELIPFGTASDDAVSLEDLYVDVAVNGEGVCVTYEPALTLL